MKFVDDDDDDDVRTEFMNTKIAECGLHLRFVKESKDDKTEAGTRIRRAV